MEQEIAARLDEAHAHLSQWTTAIWDHPIQLVDSGEDDALSAADTLLLDTAMEASGGTNALQAAGNTHQSGEFPVVPKEMDRSASHRRRRLAAALADTDDSDST